MIIKRLILAVISIVFGLVTTYVIVKAIGTNPEEYGPMYFGFTTLALACLAGIWLDKFMGTKFLPE